MCVCAGGGVLLNFKRKKKLKRRIEVVNHFTIHSTVSGKKKIFKIRHLAWGMVKVRQLAEGEGVATLSLKIKLHGSDIQIFFLR